LRLGRQSAYDAAYIVLAQELAAELWTLDAPLARALGFPVQLIEPASAWRARSPTAAAVPSRRSARTARAKEPPPTGCAVERRSSPAPPWGHSWDQTWPYRARLGSSWPARRRRIRLICRQEAARRVVATPLHTREVAGSKPAAPMPDHCSKGPVVSVAEALVG
jgi:hypothetical protein